MKPHTIRLTLLPLVALLLIACPQQEADPINQAPQCGILCAGGDNSPDPEPNPDPSEQDAGEPDAVSVEDIDEEVGEGDGGLDTMPSEPDIVEIPEIGCAEEGGEACASDEHCDMDGNRCVGCLEDLHCGPDRVCDPDIKVCVSCLEDAHCGGLMRCDLRSGDCVEVSVCEGEGCSDRGVCTSSDDCEEGRFCTPEGCQDAPPECGMGGRVCPQGAYCFAGQCELFECEGDSDCAGGRACHPDQGVCVQCVDDAQCDGGACQVDLGFCVQCAEDAHCQGQQTCETFLGECVESGACSTDEDCLGARRCEDLGEGQFACVGALCADDPFEPNDNPGESVVLPEGESSVSVCVEDDDWFRLPVEAGRSIVVQIRFDARHAVLTGALHDPQGDEIAFAGDDEFLGFIQIVVEGVEEAGDYQLHVEHLGGDAFDYDITWLSVPEGFCLNDSLEPSDGPDRATPLDPEGIIPINARTCPGDEDWYSVNLEAGLIYHADLRGEDESVGIEVFGPDLVTRMLRDNGPALHKRVSFETTEGGTHFVRVFAIDHGQSASYDLRVD